MGAMRGRGTTWAEEEVLEDTGGVAAAMAAAESASRPAGASGLGSSRIRVRVLASTRARSCQAIAAGEATYAHARVRQLEAAAVLHLEGLLDGSSAFGHACGCGIAKSPNACVTASVATSSPYACSLTLLSF